MIDYRTWERQHVEAEKQRQRARLVKRTLAALRESMQSIVANATGSERTALIAESVAQAKRYFAKSLAAVEGGDEGEGIDILEDQESESAIPDDLLDKVVQMHEGQMTRAEALQWLLSDPTGREVARQSRNKRGDSSMSSVEKLKAERLAKLQALGPVEIAKSVLAGHDERNFDLTEEEFSELIRHAAQKAHPGLSKAQAFTKVFGAPTEEGVLLRKARAAIMSTSTASTAYPFPHL